MLPVKRGCSSFVFFRAHASPVTEWRMCCERYGKCNDGSLHVKTASGVVGGRAFRKRDEGWEDHGAPLAVGKNTVFRSIQVPSLKSRRPLHPLVSPSRQRANPTPKPKKLSSKPINAECPGARMNLHAGAEGESRMVRLPFTADAKLTHDL